MGKRITHHTLKNVWSVDFCCFCVIYNAEANLIQKSGISLCSNRIRFRTIPWLKRTFSLGHNQILENIEYSHMLNALTCPDTCKAFFCSHDIHKLFLTFKKERRLKYCNYWNNSFCLRSWHISDVMDTFFSASALLLRCVYTNIFKAYKMPQTPTCLALMALHWSERASDTWCTKDSVSDLQASYWHFGNYMD